MLVKLVMIIYFKKKRNKMMLSSGSLYQLNRLKIEGMVKMIRTAMYIIMWLIG